MSYSRWYPGSILMALCLGIVAMFASYPSKEPCVALRIVEMVATAAITISALVVLWRRPR